MTTTDSHNYTDILQLIEKREGDIARASTRTLPDGDEEVLVNFYAPNPHIFGASALPLWFPVHPDYKPVEAPAHEARQYAACIVQINQQFFICPYRFIAYIYKPTVTKCRQLQSDAYAVREAYKDILYPNSNDKDYAYFQTLRHPIQPEDYQKKAARAVRNEEQHLIVQDLLKRMPLITTISRQDIEQFIHQYNVHICAYYRILEPSI